MVTSAPLEIRAPEQDLGRRDFVGALGDQLAAQPAPVVHGVGTDNFHSLAIEPFLAVDGHLAGRIARPQHVVLPGQQRCFQGPAVQVAEQPEEGGFAGRAEAGRFAKCAN